MSCDRTNYVPLYLEYQGENENTSMCPEQPNLRTRGPQDHKLAGRIDGRDLNIETLVSYVQLYDRFWLLAKDGSGPSSDLIQGAAGKRGQWLRNRSISRNTEQGADCFTKHR